MYIKVSLVDNVQDFLWYSIPPEWKNITIGSIVRVPLRNRNVLAFIEEIYLEKPQVSFAIKSAIGLEPLCGDSDYSLYLHKLASYYFISKLVLLRRIKHILHQSPKELIDHESTTLQHVQLTSQQENVVNTLKDALLKETFQPFLLHGVTGSGKTEVYKKIIEKVFSLGKSVIFLVPEVTLAVQFTKIFNVSFSHDVVCSFHSATSAAEKKRLWSRLQQEKPCLIIGVHLPVLLPIARLGFIIVDEEHEIGYQEKKYPRINSKEAALLRAQLYNIPILLGSATPSLTSFYNVQHKQWKLLLLPERFSGNYPKINIVNLRDFKQRKEFWFSKELVEAIKDRLAKKEQSIIFINRRGHSFFVQCKECSFVFECLRCSVSLTLHNDNILKCHYCDFVQKLPLECSKCHHTKFLYKGIGTQQAVKVLQKMFPKACIERADMDATINRKKWQNIVDQMHSGAIDILVGTQTITKGYDFKKVTLVGILWADLNLHFPMYNACETSLQQLIQVAGRAGRHSAESLVIVQTMGDHYIFSYMSENQYIDFAQQEILLRRNVLYPPIIRLAEIELCNMDQYTLEVEAQKLCMWLKQQSDQIIVLGPASPPVEKIKHVLRKKIYLKSMHQSEIHRIIYRIPKEQFTSKLFFQPNPLS